MDRDLAANCPVIHTILKEQTVQVNLFVTIVCVMGEPSYDNSFRILNNFLMTCITKHKFAKANVFSVKGII